MTPTAAVVQKRYLALGGLRIDLTLQRVMGENGPSGMTTRAEELLLLLCRHPNALVTRKEILNSVWAGAVVEDAAVTNCVWQIRKALGERHKDLLQTRSRRGYQMTITDECWRDELNVSKSTSIPESEIAAIAEGYQRLRDGPESISRAVDSIQKSHGLSRAQQGGALRSRMWLTAVVAPLAFFAGLLTGTQKKHIADAPVAVIAPGTDSIAVMVVAPDHADALRVTILHKTVTLAYLRDMTVRALRHDLQRYEQPRAQPRVALAVEVLGESEQGLTATIRVVSNTQVESRTYRGAAQGLAEMAQRMIESRLPPAVRTPTPAGDAYVSGVVAEQRLDMDGALADYRKALALDPELVPARIAAARYGFAQGRWQEAIGLIQPLTQARNLPKVYRCDLNRLLLDVAPEHLREKAIAESRSACG